MPVVGDSNSAPVRDATDNRDGTTSGGRFSITLSSTSSPAITDLHGTVFSAAPLGDGSSVGGDGCVIGCGGSGGPDPADTPELDSLLLFGSGLSGLAGYGLTRLRARRKREISR